MIVSLEANLMKYTDWKNRKVGWVFDMTGVGEFNEADLELIELETIGGRFTWSNGPGKNHTQTRLD